MNNKSAMCFSIPEEEKKWTSYTTEINQTDLSVGGYS